MASWLLETLASTPPDARCVAATATVETFMTSSSEWTAQLRPVLAELAARFDAGTADVDLAWCAAVCRLSEDSVVTAVTTLNLNGLIEMERDGNGRWQITRICPLARQLLGPAHTVTNPRPTNSSA